jgi:peptidoglycan hydrolase-like protein with peptidoglycan-binding domain
MTDTTDAFDPANFVTLYRDDTDADPASGWVSYLQQRLQDKGFDPGPIDGLFGPRTEAAVKAAQTWAGIKEDGVVGNATWGVLHDAFGIPGGTNRANPHHGHGGGGGGGGGGSDKHDLTADRIFFSTTPFYSPDTDCIHMELVQTQGDPFAVGDLLAELTVTGPDSSFDMDQNFTAQQVVAPTQTIALKSIRVGATSAGTRIAFIVLDSGHGDSRTFSFEPNFVADEPQAVDE